MRLYEAQLQRAWFPAAFRYPPLSVQWQEIQVCGFFSFRTFEYFIDLGFVFQKLLICNVSIYSIKFNIYIGIQGWNNLV